MKDKLREEVRKVLSEYFSFRKMEFHEMMISQYESSDFERFLKKFLLSGETIEEGLIKSKSPELAYQIFRRITGDSAISFLRDRGVFFINILSLSDSELERLFNSFKQMGYFVSEIITIKKDEPDSNYASEKFTEDNLQKSLLNKEELKLLSLQVNGYYVNQIENEPNLLYHITKKSLLDKIKKQGLVPKSKSKKVYHPERVYFALDINSALALTKDFKQYFNDDMLLLTISTEKLNNVKFYEDPDYAKFGVFTLDNIPPQAIVDYKEV